METAKKIEENFEEKTDRELAVDLDLPEDEVRETRRSEGLLRLDCFENSERPENLIEMEMTLDEMKKRQLQGFIGEKITSLMESKVKKQLEKHLEDSWVLRRKSKIVRKDRALQSYWFGGRPGKNEISIDGDTVKHFDAEEEEIKQELGQKCVALEEELFKKFREVKNPWIDFNFHALKLEEKIEKEFACRDFSKGLEGSEAVNVEIPVASDFKVIALEVKTSRSGATSLLTENQRKVRNMADRSPFIDFFTLKVDTEFEELDIPEKFTGVLQKHS